MSANSPAQPYTQSTPQAHIIASDAEALAIAHEIAAVLKTRRRRARPHGHCPGGDRQHLFQQRTVGHHGAAPLWRRRGLGRDPRAGYRHSLCGGSVVRPDPPEPLLPAGGYSSAGQRRPAGVLFAQVLQGYRFANALSETGGKRSLIFVPVSRKAQTVCGSMVVKATAPARCTPTGLAFWRWTPTIAPSSLSSPRTARG